MNRKKSLFYCAFIPVALFFYMGLVESTLFIHLFPSLMERWVYDGIVVGVIIFSIFTPVILVILIIGPVLEWENFDINYDDMYKTRSRRKFLRNMIIYGLLFIANSSFVILQIWTLQVIHPPTLSLYTPIVGYWILELAAFLTQEKAPKKSGES